MVDPVFHTGSHLHLPFDRPKEIVDRLHFGNIHLRILRNVFRVHLDPAPAPTVIAYADHAGMPGSDKAYKVPEFTRFAALSVKPEGTVLVPYDVTDAEFEAFLDCKGLYDWDRQRSRKVKLG